MLRRTDIAPSMLATLAVAIAVVVLMVPTCAMIGCTMTGKAMFLPFGSQTSASAPCGGTYIVSKAPVSTGPAGSDASVLMTVAALVLAFALFIPRAEATPVRSARDGPPPSSEVSDDVPLRI